MLAIDEFTKTQRGIYYEHITNNDNCNKWLVIVWRHVGSVGFCVQFDLCYERFIQ
jgi:hypothetical protein